MNSQQIATLLEGIRGARETARQSDKAQDWAQVDRLHRDLCDHAEGMLWTLLAENSTLKRQIDARAKADSAMLLKDAS